ncbi:MAG: exopolysaccharide Pel transporter PelG [Bryobacteraceae bacterium]
MAGIGFELRKLAARGDLSGLAQGYFHAGVAAAGPWLMTVIALAAVNIVAPARLSPLDRATFQGIVLYNFGFSLIAAAPIAAVATRFLADAIFSRDLSGVTGMLVGALGLTTAVVAPPAALFYLARPETAPAVKTLAIVNAVVIGGIWIATVFSTALKNHQAVTRAFGLGLTLGLAGVGWLGPYFGLAGMLAGFTAGLSFTLFALIARALAEYRHPARAPLAFLEGFRRHRMLALSALVYNTAIWADKWVMWMATERTALPNGLVSYPDYDTAMFFAYLTILPSLAFFVVEAETEFFERYRAFFRSILEHGSWETILERQEEIAGCIWRTGRTLALMQTGIAAAAILAAPRLFEAMHLNLSQYGIFRLGVVGAGFHMMLLFLGIVLGYFELHRVALACYGLFLALNTGFTLLSLHFGFAWYGWGYLMASALAFLAAFLATAGYLGRLPYVSMVLTNPALSTRTLSGGAGSRIAVQ